jgi:hypothetical protein
MRLEERERNKDRKGTRWFQFYKRNKKAMVNLMCPAKMKVMRTREFCPRKQRKKTPVKIMSIFFYNFLKLVMKRYSLLVFYLNSVSTRLDFRILPKESKYKFMCGWWGACGGKGDGTLKY